MSLGRIGVIFVEGTGGALGGEPVIYKVFAKREEKIKNSLIKLFPDIDFSFHIIRSLEDIPNVLNKLKDVMGYVIFVFNCIHGLLRPFLWSSKPVVLLGETYGGAGDFLLEYSRAIKEEYPVVGCITKKIDDEKLLKRYIKLLEVILRLRRSKILFIVSPGMQRHLKTEYPLGTDLYSVPRTIQAIFGITPILMDVEEFKSKYYNKVPEGEAKKIADMWIKGAVEVKENRIDEIVKQAKLYLALKEAIKDYNVDAVALDCIVLYRGGFLDAWPCLAYMELARRGEAVPVCEADPYSATVLLIMKYLANKPGFISDPSPDTLADEVVYYHCFAPITPRCYGDKEVCPYVIAPAHLGDKRASVHVKLPIGEKITVLGLDPEEKIITVHTAETLRNELSPESCATKLIGKTNTKAILKNWRWRAGWHRVVFYGDWREEIKDLAKLLGLKVLEEDKE